MQAQGGVARENQDREVLRETRAHTEASIAILLYSHLCEQEDQIVHPSSVEQMENIEPGALVEVTGVIRKNAVDTFIDYIDAILILSNLADPKPDIETLSKMRKALDDDRQRTPISNVLLQASQPEGLTAILTLRRENLRDLTLSELHRNSARVLGKVTQVVRKGAAVSAFGNYGLALASPEMLRGMFAKVAAAKNAVAEFSEVEVAGPAVQILPLMIFV